MTMSMISPDSVEIFYRTYDSLVKDSLPLALFLSQITAKMDAENRDYFVIPAKKTGRKKDIYFQFERRNDELVFKGILQGGKRMESIKGTVTKLKIIQFSQQPLVYFQLANINCLIATHSLNFLADVEAGMKIVVLGKRNTRGQFIVAKYAVLGRTKLMNDIQNYQTAS